jgi:hypothetical protein
MQIFDRIRLQDIDRLLPGTAPDAAQGAGEGPRYSFDIRITSFPDQVRTAPEMEQLMRATPAAA